MRSISEVSAGRHDGGPNTRICRPHTAKPYIAIAPTITVGNTMKANSKNDNHSFRLPVVISLVVFMEVFID
nr:hypothetical protein [Desulfopila sp. IMCC35006]